MELHKIFSCVYYQRLETANRQRDAGYNIILAEAMEHLYPFFQQWNYYFKYITQHGDIKLTFIYVATFTKNISHARRMWIVASLVLPSRYFSPACGPWQYNR